MAEKGSYGRELALRAHVLLKQLEGEAKETPGDGPSIGSLYPTFLLSMAMPIIIQPYERFLATKAHRNRLFVDFDGYSEGSKLAIALGELSSEDGLADTPLGDVPWRFAFLRTNYMLSQGMPKELSERLREPKAENAARRKSPGKIFAHLRHALAHGSIVYLDKDWKPSLYGPVKYFLFVNAPNQTLTEFLLISVEDFRRFIGSWAGWLHEKEYAEVS